MQEKLIESRLKRIVEKQKGIALKWSSFYYTGMPDRIVLLPCGKIFFVELKTTGKKLRQMQIVAFKMLKKLGFQVFVIDSQEGLDVFEKLIKE
jgi:hypothetical protein